MRHLSFETAADYVAGDVAVVAPRNADRDVARALRVLRRADPTLTLEGRLVFADVPARTFSPPRPHLPPRAPLGLVLSMCRDLAVPPPPNALGLLALFVGDDDEQRAKLVELSGPQGAALFREYVTLERRSLLDVLEDFDGCAPPLDAFLDVLPWLRPRQYSIASEGGSGTLDLCVAVAEFATPFGTKKRGLASSWLCGASPGVVTTLAVKRGAFVAPPDEAPLVCVGPGTGVAPFRAMLRARGPGSAPALLFFGCRDEHKDRLYADEFAAMANVDVDVSVSRHKTAAMRRRVTAALRSRGREVADLVLAGGAHFFVAGNAQMASDVSDALLAILVDHCDQIDSKRAAALLRKLDKERRFAVEGFG